MTHDEKLKKKIENNGKLDFLADTHSRQRLDLVNLYTD